MIIENEGQLPPLWGAGGAPLEIFFVLRTLTRPWPIRIYIVFKKKIHNERREWEHIDIGGCAPPWGQRPPLEKCFCLKTMTRHSDVRWYIVLLNNV